ncbi:unnamed protein product, partial [Angiostrongylus costaricensis]|uniref:Pecanex-like protein n=1 Tax=Angiostrongylus costaricensis TaxID=334426 RepID=A0A0R3PGI0_ANGCS
GRRNRRNVSHQSTAATATTTVATKTTRTTTTSTTTIPTSHQLNKISSYEHINKYSGEDFRISASLSMLENPTQNSAAAYTANWVSSTSSIPPEMRDEPEVMLLNFYARRRPATRMGSIPPPVARHAFHSSRVGKLVQNLSGMIAALAWCMSRPPRVGQICIHSAPNDAQ